MKILVTGGSGLLGTHICSELRRLNVEYLAPTHGECDILNINHLETIVDQYKPNTIIHCAAIAKFVDVEKDPIKGLQVNVVGTANIAHICMKHSIRLVYISTSHVFDGTKGLYQVTDQINPLTKYAKSKAASEYVTTMCNNYLVVRTEFCDVDFPFEFAYVDKWSSKDYVDKIAPIIVSKSLSSEFGVCHVGSVRRSFYELAVERNPNVKPGSIKEAQQQSTVPILVDTSFNL